MNFDSNISVHKCSRIRKSHLYSANSTEQNPDRMDSKAALAAIIVLLVYLLIVIILAVVWYFWSRDHAQNNNEKPTENLGNLRVKRKQCIERVQPIRECIGCTPNPWYDPKDELEKVQTECCEQAIQACNLSCPSTPTVAETHQQTIHEGWKMENNQTALPMTAEIESWQQQWDAALKMNFEPTNFSDTPSELNGEILNEFKCPSNCGSEQETVECLECGEYVLQCGCDGDQLKEVPIDVAVENKPCFCCESNDLSSFSPTLCLQHQTTNIGCSLQSAPQQPVSCTKRDSLNVPRPQNYERMIEIVSKKRSRCGAKLRYLDDFKRERERSQFSRDLDEYLETQVNGPRFQQRTSDRSWR